MGTLKSYVNLNIINNVKYLLNDTNLKLFSLGILFTTQTNLQLFVSIKGSLAVLVNLKCVHLIDINRYDSMYRIKR